MTFTISKYRSTAFPYQVRWTENGTKYSNVFRTVQQCMDYARAIDRKPRIIDRTGTVDRWSDAVHAIGTDRMLSLPEVIRNALSDCTEIDTKVKLLEAIVSAL